MGKVTAAEDLIDKTLNDVIRTEAHDDDDDDGGGKEMERSGEESGKSSWSSVNSQYF